MDFAQQTAAYISQLPPEKGLTAIGLPSPNARWESDYWEYRDSIYIPLQVFGGINFTANLFTRQTGSELVRNLLFPLAADAAFLNFATFCHAEFFIDPELTISTPMFGPSIQVVADRLLSACRLETKVSNKTYANTCIRGWTNYEIPSILQPLDGQAASAPFAVSPASYNGHHRVYYSPSPAIAWPASSTVTNNVFCNVHNWWLDLTGDDFLVTDEPWKTKVEVRLDFTFCGTQVRVVK